MQPKLRKIFAFLLCFLLCFEQSGFAQMAGQLDISSHLAALRNTFVPDVFRPLHLRYLSYNPIENNFQLFLDKGSLKNPSQQELQETTRTLLNYFFIGITLPNDTFWVNLRPDAEDNIIDEQLAQTDVGKIMLETDLQLKKDTAKFTSSETPEGREYWDKLYQKAGEIFGSQNITIPTLTRPWIVPDEIIIRETTDSAYIYKATLKVMLEQDYLKDSAVYNFKDDRLKELNEYSSQLIRELIIPKLNKEINSSKRYAPLRQVYYSLIMAQWFKARYYGKDGLYSHLINRRDLTNFTSRESWSKTTYFKEYQKSFKDGEYNIQEPIYTPYGQTIRSYFSGGISGIAPYIPNLGSTFIDPKTGTASSSIVSPTTPSLNHNVMGVRVKATDIPGEMDKVELLSLNPEKEREAVASSALNKSLQDELKEINDYILRFMFEKPEIIETSLHKKIKIEEFIPGLIPHLSESDRERYAKQPVILPPPFTAHYLAEESTIRMPANREGEKRRRTIAHELSHAIVDHLVGTENIDASINEAYASLGELIIDGVSSLNAQEIFNYYGFFGFFYIVNKQTHDVLRKRSLRKYLDEYGYDEWEDRKMSEGADFPLNFEFFAFEKIAADFLREVWFDKDFANLIIDAAREDMLKYGKPIHFIGMGIVNKIFIEVRGDLQRTARLMGSLLLEPSNFQGLDVYGYITKTESLLRESAGPVTQSAGSSAEKKESAGSPVEQQETIYSPVSDNGGIDFRSLPIVSQAITNLSANISSSAIYSLVSINLGEEWQQIEKMATLGITPSSERIKEYIQISCTQDSIIQDRDKIVLCISDILRLEEERYSPTDPLLRDILVMLESVRQPQELTQVFLGKTVF